MKSFLFSAIIFCVSLFPVKADEVSDARIVLGNVLHDYIQPGYAQLEAEARRLSEINTVLCSEPSEENLKQARDAFSRVALTWAKMEWLRVGPAMSDNRLERILFYPDRKSTGLKQVQRALANEDETARNAQTLAKKSVAMQGLGALEYLLFGTGNEVLATQTQSFRCNYASSVSDNLKNIAAQLSAGWNVHSELAELWLNPDENNPLFRNDREALNLVIGTIIHGVEAVRDVRIGSFLKETSDKDRPRSALFWRSENTLPMVQSNLTGLLELFDKSRIAQLLPDEKNTLSDQIRFEFDQGIKTSGSLSSPIADHLLESIDRQKLTYLRLTTDYVVSAMNNELAPALGLKAGFSFGDGD